MHGSQEYKILQTALLVGLNRDLSIAPKDVKALVNQLGHFYHGPAVSYSGISAPCH